MTADDRKALAKHLRMTVPPDEQADVHAGVLKRNVMISAQDALTAASFLSRCCQNCAHGIGRQQGLLGLGGRILCPFAEEDFRPDFECGNWTEAMAS